MSQEHQETARLRPYARLLTMLGEQLIKSDRVALVELVKNSYDADASRVTVDFVNFDGRLRPWSSSSIVVDDNGSGMSFDLVRDHWLNPATDVKARRKKVSAITPIGRFIQGEKGIGRFAAFKIGATCRLITKTEDSSTETVVQYDISFLDTEVLSDAPSRFLDEVPIQLFRREPEVFSDGASGTHGTRIEISKLRSSWGRQVISRAYDDLLRLQPLKGLLTGDVPDQKSGFKLEFLQDGAQIEGLDDTTMRLRALNERAVLKVVGAFDAETQQFSLEVNDASRQIAINDTEMRGLWVFRRYFEDELDLSKGDDVRLYCGDFSFEFLIFDIRPNAPTLFKLDEEERELVREHRIYLYRDEVRVLPYGDPDDDWLQIDAYRGTQGAGRVLSNDQTVGLVYISQAQNPDLRDKTSREGLVDSGRPYTDFRAGLLLIIALLRKRDFAAHLAAHARQAEAVAREAGRTSDRLLESLSGDVADRPMAKQKLARIRSELQRERSFADTRVSRTEQLAGIGLSVETASHDIISTGTRALEEARLLRQEVSYELGKASPVYARSGIVAEAVSFVVSRLSDVQGIFVSSRRGAKRQDVLPFVRKVVHIYSGITREADITVRITGNAQLTAKVSEAALLQIFLNLMDNAVYWIRASRTSAGQIVIHVDSSTATIRVSDNGPGVDPADRPYIFDAFYSAKGDAGRGLGLYIAREIAMREGLGLSLEADGEKAKGASFVVSFGSGGG